MSGAIADGLDSLTITAADFGASLAFYEAALGALGWERLDELVDEEEDDADVEAAGWGRPDGPARLWLVTGNVATVGVHVRLRAASPDAVLAFHRAGTDAGGRDHATPRRWPLYRRGEFNAIVRDPGGNLVEAVAPE